MNPNEGSLNINIKAPKPTMSPSELVDQIMKERPRIPTKERKDGMIGILDMCRMLEERDIKACCWHDSTRKVYILRATKNGNMVTRNVPSCTCGGSFLGHDYVRRNIVKSIIDKFEEIEKIENEEKENNMNGIEWKVNSVDFSRSGDDKGTIYPNIEGHIYGAYTGDLADIANQLQIKLNRKDADYSTQMSLYEKMCKDYDFAVKVKEAVNRRFGDPRKVPSIEKVIFNDPATIVIWKDGTKTVVKAVNEAFDPEKGLAMAITKKALGNEGNYYNDLKEWLEDYEPKTGLKEGADVIRIKRVLEILDRATDRSKVTKADLIASIHMAMDCLCDILDEGSDE